MSQTEVPIDRESTLRRGLSRLTAMAEWLREIDEARIDRALLGAAAMLADAESPLGRQARETVPSRARLSPAMLDWALTSTLETVTEDALGACRDARDRAIHPHRPVPARLHAVVLSSNLCTAAIKPIVWSLLCRTPVALKLSVNDEGLAELFALALALIDEDLGRVVLPVRFSRTDEALTQTLFERADAVSIYGSDGTMRDLRPLVPITAELIPHGHGLGIAFVGKDTAESDLDALIASLALDVAAYDQRGCLSPHAIFVEDGGPLPARELARRLAEDGLKPLAHTLPRAALEVEESTAQVQWRRVSQALGELFEGDGYSVAFDDRGPVRACPLARNVAVHSVGSALELGERLGAFGAHLKCLAVSGGEIALAPPLCPRVTMPGRMQRPTLLDLHDGRRPWDGLFRLTF